MTRAPRSRPGADSGGVPSAENPAGRAPNTVLDRVFAAPEQQPGDALSEATVAAWSTSEGTLADGRRARVAASCLLRPAPGDRVLVWSAAAGAQDARVLSVMERPGDGELVLASSRPLAIETPRFGLSARSVSVAANDFVTSARNRHAVEHTRTESVRLRVAQLGADVRRADTVSDEIGGTFVQRVGTWVSTTVREARLRARTFLFD